MGCFHFHAYTQLISWMLKLILKQIKKLLIRRSIGSEGGRWRLAILYSINIMVQEMGLLSDISSVRWIRQYFFRNWVAVPMCNNRQETRTRLSGIYRPRWWKKQTIYNSWNMHAFSFNSLSILLLIFLVGTHPIAPPATAASWCIFPAS